MEHEGNSSALAVAPKVGIAHVPNETSTAHSAALAKAQVEARFTVAINRPRDIDEARLKLLADCKRPMFAELARYSKPVGGSKIEGPSIRLVEAAIRAMGNITTDSVVTYEDAEKRILNVTVCDLESNSTYAMSVVVQKTVERKNLKRGQQALGTRTNSYGETVYIVEASDDDLLNKQGALVSKAVRTLGLRILPGDLVDEAMYRALETMRAADKADPGAARKKILDAFAERGVRPEQIRQFLGHEIDVIPPNELEALRATYAAIRDGHTTWDEVMASKSSDDAPKTSKVSAAKDHLRKAASDEPTKNEEVL